MKDLKSYGRLTPEERKKSENSVYLLMIFIQDQIL